MGIRCTRFSLLAKGYRELKVHPGALSPKTAPVMHRFYVEPGQARETMITLSEREAHHASHVVRLREGERVVALDGQGSELLCQVQAIRKSEVQLKVYQRNKIPPLPFEITLVQAVPKGKMMDTIVQKAAELGVHRIVPILSERTVPQIDSESGESKIEKWRWVAIDAIKQCGSAWLPHIDLPLKPAEFLGRGDRFDLSLVAALQPGAKHPRAYFTEFHEEKRRQPKSISVWVGPEGDFTPAEMNLVRGAGALPITLGPLVLRSDTAAIYSLAVLNYELNAQS